jgi:hypothetical protein
MSNFFGSETADRELLIHHAEQFDNGAVFKRLGFLADTRLHEKKLADEVPCAVDARPCQTRSGAARQEARHCLATVGAGGLESSGRMIDKREILEIVSSFSLLRNV